MNKQIISSLLSLVMIMSMLITAVPVLAANTEVEFVVASDKTTANPGDTVNFSVSIGAVDNFGVLEFSIIVPTGLTIVDSSVKIPDGVAEAMDSDGAIVLPTPSNQYIWSYSAQSTGYTANSSLVILTFSCTVDNDCAFGDKDITISMTDCYSNDLEEQPYTITKETVKIEAASVAVTGVTIDETLSVNTGETKTPSFTVAPADASNKTVSFTSDNTAVATVNETTGAVTGVKKGTATITVKTADGNFTDTCTVTVSCSHAKKNTIAEQASTCKEKGWDAYKRCDDCGQLFSTSDVEISAVPFRTLAPHTGGTATCTTKAVCTVCNQSYGDFVAHRYTAETKKTEALKTAGNCRDKAVYYYSCSGCGNVERNDAHTFEGDKNPNNHAGGTENKGGVAATCDKEGHKDDTYCLGCKVKIANGAVIEPLGHDYSVLQHDATQHWHKCSRCDSTTTREAHKGGEATCTSKAVCSACNTAYGELNANNHKNTEVRDAKPATENAEGYTGDTWCKDCNTKIKTGTVTPKLDHEHTDITKHNAVAATCKSTGMKEYWTCSSPKCAGKYYSNASCSIEITIDNLVVPKNPNNHAGGTEKKGGVAATCNTAGHLDDTYCLGCKTKIANGAVINAFGHDYSYLQHDATHHWYRCSRCYDTTDSEAHMGGEATCSKKAICSVCRAAYGELNANNHKNTEVRGAKPATESAEGYTGDTWCIDCNTKIASGTVINAPHDGDYIYGIAPGTTVDKLKKELGNGIIVKNVKNGIVGTGTKVVVDGKEYTVIIKGDIDGDGSITATDYLRVRLHILKRIRLKDNGLLAAHVSTKIGKPISADDYTAIRLHILKRKLIVQ